MAHKYHYSYCSPCSFVSSQAGAMAFCHLTTLSFSLLAAVFLSICAPLVAESNAYIVYMGEKLNQEAEQIQDLHHRVLSDLLGSDEASSASMLYSYKHGFSGFAAILPPYVAKRIVDYPGVARVMPNRILNIQTTRSWDFLHMNPISMHGLLSESRFGQGSIIGILDTGIWPESESFKDHGMSEVPSHWKGVCQEGEQFSSSNCNRKIIGARWYIKGYNAEFGYLNTSDSFEFLSARDAVGHGSHTSSTAAGAFVSNASFMGLAKGVARGGAPHSRIAVYKVCWASGGCSSADLLAAFDDAISDGVDVLSVSLGSAPPLDPFVEDALAVGSFHAVAKGITVVCSGGNSGSRPQTVINTAPWLVTVAASTIDRSFPTTITLGNNQTLVGQALYTGRSSGKFLGVVYSEDIALSGGETDKASTCEEGSLNATLAKGKVVLCFQSRSQGSAVVAIKTVKEVQGVGLIFAQFPTKDVFSSIDFPFVQVDYQIATIILAYIQKTRYPILRFGFTKTALGTSISPEVAFFSSRGPNSLAPSVLKPDIAAPGVNILAAWSPYNPPVKTDTQGPLYYNIESGTSMSCPHVSGIVALLRSLHPSWTPAAIKSSLVTTASTRDLYGQHIIAEGAPHKQADPFDYGGGHIDPNKAANPGLIFDMGVADHIRFLCFMGYNNSAISLMARQVTVCPKGSGSMADLNLPSVSIPQLRKSLTISRTVTNVGPVLSVYVAHVQAPPGVKVAVKPSCLSFNATTNKLKFQVTFSPLLRVQGRYAFGSLMWHDGQHVVKIPLVVRIVIDDLYSDT
ncbi:subtilisin-like protease SBT3.9 [Amborella trichopoda]|nr:subtilisin-like protease SBT3.9 [Amborella trichopoda]|eukprot:XP_006829160.2 subtilisin-like protease SBT3.9 [Amborella trichopoda]